jgi:proline dehydrogenase
MATSVVKLFIGCLLSFGVAKGYGAALAEVWRHGGAPRPLHSFVLAASDPGVVRQPMLASIGPLSSFLPPVGRALGMLEQTAARALPLVPRRIVRTVASRYIAGAELGDACRVVRELNAQGKLATLDVLGEDAATPAEASGFAAAYLEALEAIERERLDATVSVKPTAFGLGLGRDICRENLDTVVRSAATRGNFVRIDMEDSSTTSDTLALYRALREMGHDNVGIVLQGRLRRTLDDVRALADLRPNVRVCKGIYLEPEEIALRDADEIRESCVRIVEALLDAGCYVALASHDERVIEPSLRLVADRGLGPDDYELQFLLGVRAWLGDRLVRTGHRLRLYVPYGARWYEYAVRRLQENPHIATQVAVELIRRPVWRW